MEDIPENFEFPFQPYDIQVQFMKNLYNVIENKKLGIFESPTGTGKSMSIICGVIRWLQDHYKNSRKMLEQKIETLEKEEIDDGTDWLQSQYKTIQKRNEIMELKQQLKKIEEFENMLKAFKTKKSQNNVHSEKMPFIKNEEPIEDADLIINDEVDIENEDDCDNSEEDEIKKHIFPKIYICSRTHSQLSQFIGEIIKSPFASDVCVVTLASRQSYCLNESVKRLKNISLMNEKCSELRTGSTKKTEERPLKKIKRGTSCSCPYNAQERIKNLGDEILRNINDIEDIVTLGNNQKACPYYATRLAAENAQIILVPYNTILHKATREANNIILKNNIVIIDEAHNLLEAISQMHSCELNLKQIKEASEQINCYKQRFHSKFSAINLLYLNQLVFILKNLKNFLENDKNEQVIFKPESFVSAAQIDHFNMFKLIQFCKANRLGQKLRNYSLRYGSKPEEAPKKGLTHFLKTVQTKGKSDESSEQLPNPEITTQRMANPLVSVISFLETLTYTYEDGRIFVYRTTNDTKLQFMLLNSSNNFSDLVKEARAIIVAGGTMKPFSDIRNLFLDSGANQNRLVEFSCDHIIPPNNILPIIVTKGPKNEKLLFNYENRMAMGESIKTIIEQSCSLVDGGIVVFFPSYAYENWIWDQIKDSKKIKRPIFREPKESGSVESILKKYSDSICKKSSFGGALLLSVVGGKLSEGLNFSDDLGRCIIVVGLPYGNITAIDLKEKMSYLDKKEGQGAGQQFYKNLCMKAVNQSIGRAVRHRNDYASILLIDERYAASQTRSALPAWINRSLKICNYQETFENIVKFFQEKNKSK